MSQVGEQLTGVLSKIRGAAGGAAEEADAGDEREGGVAMEMRGSFGRCATHCGVLLCSFCVSRMACNAKQGMQSSFHGV